MKERQFFYHLKISVSSQTTFIHLNARVIFSSDHHRLRNRNCVILFKMAENWPFPQISGGWSRPEILRQDTWGSQDFPGLLVPAFFLNPLWPLLFQPRFLMPTCSFVLFCAVPKLPPESLRNWMVLPCTNGCSTTCRHSTRLYCSYLSCLHVQPYFHWGPRRDLGGQVSFIEKLKLAKIFKEG